MVLTKQSQYAIRGVSILTEVNCIPKTEPLPPIDDE